MRGGACTRGAYTWSNTSVKVQADKYGSLHHSLIDACPFL